MEFIYGKTESNPGNHWIIASLNTYSIPKCENCGSDHVNFKSDVLQVLVLTLQYFLSLFWWTGTHTVLLALFVLTS